MTTAALTAADYAAIAAEAAQLDNQLEVVTFAGREPPKAGIRVGRLRDYIEWGHHEDSFQGEKKDDAPFCSLTFELLGKEDIKEIEVKGEKEGEKVKKTIAETITINNLKMSKSDKANFHKLAVIMAGCHGIPMTDTFHMSMLLGKPFVLEVVHNESTNKTTGVKKTYANIKSKEKGWLITPPFQVDAVAGTKTPYKVPELVGVQRLFIWELAGKFPQMFHDLFIEGTSTRKRKNEETGAEEEYEHSKNWMQEKIMSASNFPGSPLETALGGAAELTEGMATEPEVGATVELDTDAVAEAVELETAAPEQAEATTKAPQLEEGEADAPASETTNDKMAELEAMGLLD
jgi:hypothetical protein